jgi:hypothetical protein
VSYVRWPAPPPGLESVIVRATGKPQVVARAQPSLADQSVEPELPPASYVEPVTPEEEHEYAEQTASVLLERLSAEVRRLHALGKDEGEIMDVLTPDTRTAGLIDKEIMETVVACCDGAQEQRGETLEEYTKRRTRENKAAIFAEMGTLDGAEACKGVRGENGEKGENSLIPISWQKENSPNSPHTHPQEAVFPSDSILADYVNVAVRITEGADCYIIGSILPVAAALLGRAAWLPWCGSRLYPNLFAMLAGKPGDRKTSTIDLAVIIARSSLPHEAFLPLAFSPETLSDEYDKGAGGRPDKLWLLDDANAVLADWQNESNGERNAAKFLRLYDCKELSEAYRRNRREDKPETQRRVVPQTSTSVVFGATFNLCMFRKQVTRAGLQRRFLIMSPNGWVARFSIRRSSTKSWRSVRRISRCCQSWRGRSP